MTEYIEQEYIRENTMEKRSYPASLAPQAVKENCIVVLPAGLGKTAIVLLGNGRISVAQQRKHTVFGANQNACKPAL